MRSFVIQFGNNLLSAGEWRWLKGKGEGRRVEKPGAVGRGVDELTGRQASSDH